MDVDIVVVTTASAVRAAFGALFRLSRYGQYFEVCRGGDYRRGSTPDREFEHLQ